MNSCVYCTREPIPPLNSKCWPLFHQKFTAAVCFVKHSMAVA
uniref:Uncharacterized protein n=1 Tax=Anguilla anguilla TaxID=7936 RepID=A0A0E9QU01_ANGAN